MANHAQRIAEARRIFEDAFNGYAQYCELPQLLQFKSLMNALDGEINAYTAAPQTRKLADQLVALCEDHLMAVYYKDVPKEWLCLLTIALYLQAIIKLHQDEWQSAIHSLDRAIIVAGSPILQAEIHDLIDEIQRHHHDVERVGSGDSEKKSKKPKLMESLTEGLQSIPCIQYPIERFQHDKLSLTRYRELLDGGQPFIIEGSMNEWPCMSERPWSDFDYLQRLIGRHRLVPVELGRSYVATGWSQKLMPFGEFFDQHIVSTSETTGYLAQHNLLRQVPAMQRDIFTPDYCFVTSSSPPTEAPIDVIIHTWFGPNGTVSPLHTDPYRNMFAQIFGEKYVRLYSPDVTDMVYPRSGSIMNNTSEIEEIESPDLKRFPLIQQAPYVEAIVRPGDLLMIPAGWWHYLRSLSISFSTSYWW